MRNINRIIFCLVLAALTLSAGSAGVWKTGQAHTQQTVSKGFDHPIVSFTFDDSWETNYYTAIPVLEKYGFKVTWYFATTFVENNASGPAVVKAIHDAGHEIGAHSVTHPYLTTVDEATLQYELTHSKKYLESLVGTGNIKSFATPYDDYNDAVVSQIENYYRSHRTTDVGYNLPADFDPYYIETQNMMSDTTEADFESWVNQAIEDKAWLVIVYHGVVRSDPGEYDTTLGNFGRQMQYVYDRRSQIAEMPISAALNELTPQAEKY